MNYKIEKHSGSRELFKYNSDTSFLFNHTLNLLSEAVYFVREDGRISYANDEACRITGYSEEELSGLHIKEIDPSISTDNWNDLWQRVREEGSVTSLETHRDKDGKSIPIKINSNYFEHGGESFIIRVAQSIPEKERITEDKFIAAERKDHLFHKNLPFNIVQYDKDARVVRINPMMMRNMNLRENDLLGKRPTEWDLYPMENRLQYEKKLMEVIRTGMNSEIFLTVAKDSDDERTYHVYLVAEHDSAGEIVGAFSFFNDISEKKRMEQTLDEFRHKFQTLIEALPDPVWIKDNNGVYLECNEALARRFGKMKNEITGTTDFDHIKPRYALFSQKKDQDALEAGESSSGEEWVAFENNDRKELWEIRRKRFFDRTGRTIGLIGVARDITEKRKMENEIRENEQLQKKLLDSFPFKIWLKDTEGHLLAANQAYAIAAGTGSVEELFGKTDFQIWPRDIALRYRKDDREVIRSGKKMFKESYVETVEEYRWTEMYNSPVVVNGVFHSTVGFEHNFTRRKHVEADGKQLEEVLDRCNDFVGLADLQGNLFFHNRAAKRMIGFPEDRDLIGYKLSDIYPVWAMKLIDETIIPQLMEKGEWTGDSAILNRNGGEIPVLQHISLHLDEHEKPQFISLIMHDSTFRQK